MLQPDETEKLNDAQLLSLHSESNHNEYLGVLYTRYTPLIYGVCLKYLRDSEDASDAVIAIFEELVDKVKRYQINEFRTWIYSVTKNYCLQQLRRTGNEISTDFSSRVVENDDVTHLLNEKKNDEARYQVLENCIKKLPAEQRKCIEMFFYGNKSYADIAVETVYPLKRVKSYIQNGKRNLKICIEKNHHETD